MDVRLKSNLKVPSDPFKKYKVLFDYLRKMKFKMKHLNYDNSIKDLRVLEVTK